MQQADTPQDLSQTEADLVVSHPEAAVLMAAGRVARVLAEKGYEVTVRPPHLRWLPGDKQPTASCDVIFVNPNTGEARASVLTLGDYPMMLAAARTLASAAVKSRLHIPMGPNGGLHGNQA